MNIYAIDPGQLVPITITDGESTLQTDNYEDLVRWIQEPCVLIIGKSGSNTKFHIPRTDSILTKLRKRYTVKYRDEAHTSVTCINCNTRGHTFHGRMFVCVYCRHIENRDTMAAKNILRLYNVTFKSFSYQIVEN